MPLKLKRNSDGQIVAVGENPVIQDENGVETTFDIEATIQAVKARNQEAADLRLKLKRYQALGEADPEEAAKALELVKKIDAKKLLDSGDVDATIRSLQESHNTELGKLKNAHTELRNRFRDTRVHAAFLGSQFVQKKIDPRIPVELLQTYFGSQFDIDDNGEVVSLDESGRPRMSKSNPALTATFDEVLEGFVVSSNMRDRLLVSQQKSGSGAQGGKGAGELGTISREAWRNLPPEQQQKYALAGAISD